MVLVAGFVGSGGIGFGGFRNSLLRATDYNGLGQVIKGIGVQGIVQLITTLLIIDKLKHTVKDSVSGVFSVGSVVGFCNSLLRYQGSS